MAGAFDPDELEFLAEDLKIKIIPSKRHRQFSLLSGDLPALEPPLPAEVPVWVAVHMRKRRECRLVVPDWLTVEYLEAKKVEEADSKVFIEMPECYIEISQILLEHFVGDIAESVKVRGLLKDIMDSRLSKLRTTLAMNIQEAGSRTKFVNLTEMELNSVRNLWTKGLDQLSMLRADQTRAPGGPQITQSGAVGNTPTLFRGNVTNITMDPAPRGGGASSSSGLGDDAE